MGGTVLWEGTARGRFVWAALAFTVPATIAGVAAVLTVGGGWAAGLFLLVLTVAADLAVLAFRRITVTIDPEAVRVRYALPHTTTVPVRDIERVEHLEDLDPMRWGGWGYRGGRRLFRFAAVVLRRGPAVLLHRRDGTRFAVTVDDAAGAVRTLEGLVGGP